ncbi:MAG: tRNA cyclic N6-threonylcarbamoyladenosine(37) synthase TcdA [Nitratiruptor sp.]|nr:tRNA cyclic N6-threonylcarbamoyladenosine(37) synthase TcdA [Nitratiruptor sp.]NPA84206.1 tRNA threonylcarbamoyladenosine dehydratase [Campylobacterota bacterium]
MRFERCKELFGPQAFQAIQESHILIVGVGGVGSFALDCLYRTGVSQITIVDGDRYEASNQNRQIGSEALGELKVEVLAQRYPGIKKVVARVDNSWVETTDFDRYHLVLDAIDDIPAKVALAQRVAPKLISSMGSARRVDPTQIRYASIWETSQDPFAKKFRNRLRQAGFVGDFPVVFSLEPPKGEGKGSFVGVTGAFGLALCAKAIEKIINERSSHRHSSLQRGAGDSRDPSQPSE